MKFALKICICTILIVAALFLVTGQVLIAQNFEAALSFRVEAAISEYSALASAMEAELYGIRLYYNDVSPEMYEEILGRAIETLPKETPCALYDVDHKLLAAYGDGFSDTLSFSEMRVRRFAYELVKDGEQDILHTAGCVSLGGDYYYLAVRYDAGDLMRFRSEQIHSVLLIHCITVAVCTALMLLISYFTSKPLQRLERFTHLIGSGNYTRRARVTTLDEIGDLTVAFNEMTGAIDQKVQALEGYAKQQKDFVASFSHELKTPMTSIIGYADMLRSAELDEEDAFMAANFIFSEGKRLEALALKLMDLVVLEKDDFNLSRGYSKRALGHVVAVVTPMLEKAQLTLVTDIEQQPVRYEKDLLLTLVTNLIDNARKASSPNKSVYLTGRRVENRYRITVRDEGIGIPKEELNRITEAFFMVDKSRARAQHGAGLGLAIGNKIAKLHGSSLHFESEPNKGTTVWFELPLASASRGGDRA